VDSAAALRVVLLDAPLEFERALRTALLPWGMHVENVMRGKPVSSLPGAAIYANALARELSADALVWLSRSPEGAALWTYDVWSDTVVARPSPDRRLDEPLAAALALSVKTWLRLSDLTLNVAGTSATDAAGTSERAELTPAPSGLAAELDQDRPRQTRTRRDDDRDDTSRDDDQDDAARWQVVIHAAGRRGAIQRNVLETRYGLEGRVAAWRSDARLTRLWLGLRLETGEPRSVSSDTFRGTYSELGAGPSVGISQRIVPFLNVGVQAGGTLQLQSVFGTLLPDGAPADRTKLAVGLRIGPELELLLEPVGLILQGAVGTSPRRKLYVADGVPVLETRGVWWILGGALRVGVF
jgi:hypothetical protein